MWGKSTESLERQALQVHAAIVIWLSREESIRYLHDTSNRLEHFINTHVLLTLCLMQKLQGSRPCLVTIIRMGVTQALTMPVEVEMNYVTLVSYR